eukprot:GFKZ01012103.1.p1 GENE.GFKZ01012103.1~~GFKZ01012103.1.p1  ORF type:complete len:785 (-),score=78.07 GFKZ01012103.1:2283-4508(-)
MNPTTPIPPDDDPHSELNILRREVRQLQATVRDTALQVSAQQDDLIHLRRSLTSTESQLEQAILREQALRSQLALHSVKRLQIESTMQAAEALIQSLRDMIHDTAHQNHHSTTPIHSPPAHQWPDRSVPRATRPRRKGSVDDVKLDLVLQRIQEPPLAKKAPYSPTADHVVPPLMPPLSAAASPTLSHHAPSSPQFVSPLNGPVQTVSGEPAASDMREEGATESVDESAPAVPASAGVDTLLRDEASGGRGADPQIHEGVPEAPAEGMGVVPDSGGVEEKRRAVVVPTMPIAHTDGDVHDPSAVSTSSLPALENSDQAPVTPMHRGGMHGWAKAPRSLTSLSSPRRVPGRQKRASSLLRSAFRPSGTVMHHSKPAIRSAGVDPGDALPRDVASIVAKAVGAPPPVALPTSITTVLSDAHGGEIYALAASEDGVWTASGGDDSVVRVYDSSGAAHASVTENARSVTALAMRPDDNGIDNSDVIIYAGGSDGTVRAIRRTEKRKAKWSVATMMHVHSQAVRRIITTDKKGMGTGPNMLLTCSTDKTIRMSDVEHGKRPFSVTAPSAVFDVDFFAGNDHLNGLMVSGHKDGGMRLWSSRDANALVGGAKVHTKGIISVSCLSDGQSVLSLGRDNAIRLSDIRMNIGIVRDMEKGVHSVSDWHRLTTNWRFVACGSGRQGVCIWNVGTGKIVRTISSEVADPGTDVLDMVTRKFRNPGSVVVPLWSACGRLACAHRMRQITFWST